MNRLWQTLARWLTSNPRRVNWLIERAQRTPYLHIEGYMGRWWLFNPYGKDASGKTMPARWSWLPSVRIHHIVRKDLDRVPHNHPWEFRSIILRGFYVEEELLPDGGFARRLVEAGDTYCRHFTDYHRISKVSPGGVWTLFITWRKENDWGFMVDGQHIPYRIYLGLDSPTNRKDAA